ncbi:MAG: transcription-repair coupling factor, partial [Prevotella sp.]|nr:transcription-repair coupling factor [Prevotella sp.]
MKENKLLSRYTKSTQAGALARTLAKSSVHSVFLEGLSCSAVPLMLSAANDRLAGMESTSDDGMACGGMMLFVLNDADEAGYMYHDLCQLAGEGKVLFFPSSYKRAVKYGQHDPANEILRTEVLARLSERQRLGTVAASEGIMVVTYPEALAELVVSQRDVEIRKILLARGQQIDIIDVEHQLRELGFRQVDYVYEPGQFAVRGSIVDVFSFSSELPLRLDFFDDEIDTIRTFEVESQLSKDMKEKVVIVPQLSGIETEKRPLTSFLPDGTPLIARDVDFVLERVGQVFEEGFSRQALAERLANATEMEQAHIMEEMRRESQLCTQTVMFAELSRMTTVEYGIQVQSNRRYDARMTFHVVPQPLFHKNFELLRDTLRQYVDAGYRIGILADSEKQVERIDDILSAGTDNNVSVKKISIKSVGYTLHEGFIDNDLKMCLFTDHQIFDRFHKYNLKSDKARHGKMALTMKELQELEPGDFIVHVDFGIGKFAGLVRVPVGNSY